MGKKQRNDSPQAQDILKSQKKPLKQFLPHNKYVKYRNKTLKKHTNEAISFIHLDKNQILKAAESLKIFEEKHKSSTDLFGEEGYIFIQIDVSKIPQEYSVRPVQIKLPSPIYSKQLHSRFTVIVSDPEDEFIEKVQNLDIPMINQVIGYEKIKKHYRNQKDKQKLLAANDLFFCDWKLYNLLRQPLGKLFYERKRYPFPINCEEVPEELQNQHSSYEEYLNSLGNSTYFMMGNGPVYSVKVARTQMKNKDIVKNIMHGAYKIVSHLREAGLTFENVRQISIKTYNSPSLPVYNYLSSEEVKMYQQNAQ